MINDAINRVSRSENLTLVEIREVFDEITSGLADSELIASFVTALHSKVETVDEIAGAVLSSREAVKKTRLPFDSDNLIENIAFSKFNSVLNVDLAVDIICSSNGLGAIKYSLETPFFNNSAFEVAACLSINPLRKPDALADLFEKTMFGYFYLSLDEKYFKYTFDVSRKLPFENLLSCINLFLNPCGAKNQMLALKSKDLVEKYAQVCLKLNNSNTIVFSCEDNLPCVIGNTFVAEAWKNKIFTYNLTPELVGLRNYTKDDVLTENPQHSAQLILEVFENKNNSPVFDYIVLNSALALYISKKAQSIMDAVDLAKKTIKDGIAFEKIKQLQKYYS